MPRFDRGSYVVDVSWMLASPGEAAALVEWALSSGDAWVVTSPTVVSLSLGPASTLLVALGVGSIISPVEPPAGLYHTLSRPEWVEACRPGEPRMEFLGGAAGDVEGVAVAYAYRDPLALLVNGVEGVHRIVDPGGVEGGLEVYVGVEGRPLLLGGPGGYVAAAVGGPVFERLRLLGPLLSGCS
ncbi:hypothetical protein [Aeropyrum camini]|uniref:Uncharacterized protein n=1 Tax=Aeropyrum camini SY1 = JCM 12091 TaxID=1198449 RepID=U3TCM4_9CREN|nr:hypothetical protein [Aeropyrum camini]BAN90161.1 hypothetical protein ACAM_0692 [Aeropyrum camini SY1 = JCM 12091]